MEALQRVKEKEQHKTSSVVLDSTANTSQTQNHCENTSQTPSQTESQAVESTSTVTETSGTTATITKTNETVENNSKCTESPTNPPLLNNHTDDSTGKPVGSSTDSHPVNDSSPKEVICQKDGSINS